MGKILRIAGTTLCLALLIFACIIAFNFEQANRLYGMLTLFDEDKILYNFSHMDDVFLTRPIQRSGNIHNFSHAPQGLPYDFSYHGEAVITDKYLKRRQTTALLVIKNNDIIFEQYYQGTSENDLRISWSIAKSFTVALFGIAINDGLIDIDAPVEKYLPEMKNTGYEGVPVRHVLQMSSGVLWNEDYTDFNSDINRMTRIFAIGGSLDEFTTTLKKEKNSGQEFHYVSMDTHILSMIARRVTGKSMIDQLEEHIWSKIGMEADANWITDSKNAEFALGGLNVRTRDYARFGLLYMKGGNWKGQQIIPESWVTASTHATSGYNMPTADKLGYGFQWWLGRDARPGEFFAVGVYGQYIYVNQPENIVIVKNSTDLNFMHGRDDRDEAILFFRAIADKLHENSSPQPAG